MVGVMSISFENVSKAFILRRERTVDAVSRFTFRMHPGEFVSFVGPSGCGKTTLLRLAAGLELCDDGTVSIDGTKITGPGPDRAVVFQGFALMPWKTVRGNIEFGLTCAGMPRTERSVVVTRYVSLMGLTGHEDARPHQLSGGMQQRVAIARSYAVRPKVLLMDEPFGALDAQTRQIMQDELKRISTEEHRSVFFITHDVSEAVYLSNRVVVLSKRPARILGVIDVDITRRQMQWDGMSSAQVSVTSAFNELKSQIWSLMHSP